MPHETDARRDPAPASAAPARPPLRAAARRDGGARAAAALRPARER
ncbi:hypothetical protein OPKNFCMD_3674 [Methylobacterium crusticola]|uniref:Uncharacterized protein n=1 Tax=Methylobacterium crusticola TaxID=1697972 RepID=A0ABQ4QZS7_9HYPH|nr:hypothetical protein [Methylobacterium crusticola]GJD50925.1 hypothetical protein OPKNFCMD_3674 [Methylobacterium crusticola]